MIFPGILKKKTFSAKHTFLTHKNKQINPKYLQKVLVQSFCIEYMHIDTYVIKHHNKFQRDMPSHIREMARESYLNIFCYMQIGSGRGRRRMSDHISSMGLKSRRAKNYGIHQ